MRQEKKIKKNMTAEEYIKKYIKKEYARKFHVLSILPEDKHGGFYHIHWDEEIPTDTDEIIVLAYQKNEEK